MIGKKTLAFLFLLTTVICCVFFLPTLVQSQQGTVTLSVGNGAGLPGSTDNQVQITLDNPDDRAA